MVPYERDVKIELKIEKIVNKGFGLGFVDRNPVFVYSAVPGDILEVEVTHKSRKVTFAKIKNIITPSEFRIKSICDSSQFCGGCDWMIIEYKKQLEFKQLIIDEIINKISIESRMPPVASVKDLHYRNKSFMPVGRSNNKIMYGMFAHRSHQIVAHKECHLHPAVFDGISLDIMSYIKSSGEQEYNEKTTKGNIRHIGFRISNDGKEILVIIVTKRRKMAFTKQLVRLLTSKYPEIVGIIQNINSQRTNKIIGADQKILFGRDYLFTNINDLKFKLNYRSFFQINYGTAENLYNEIKKNVSPEAKVIDAYCGIGSIGLYIADKVDKVWGIEENLNAVSDAVFSAELNKITNIEFYTAKVEEKISQLVDQSNADTLIVDPPRKGLDKSILVTINSSNIKKIIYVSCDPATQKRDVEILIAAGYHVKSSRLFDMFPQTYHIENLMVLERK